MDVFHLVEQIVLVIAAVVIPILAAKIAGYLSAHGDLAKQKKNLARMQEIDKMAESALNMMRINNPKSSILVNVDKVKDDLVAKILADTTIPVNKGEIASRVAGNAIFNAALDEFLSAPPKAGA